MKATLRASTRAKIVVWLDGDLYTARLADSTDRAESCLADDLFEVIAELAGLDLDQGAQAAEAMRLAETAQRRLGVDAHQEREDAEELDDERDERRSAGCDF